jgi:hypothetical protein
MAEMLNPLLATPIERYIITEKFMTLSFTVSEKMEKQFLNFSTLNLITGSDVLKGINTLEISSVKNI